MDRRTNLDEKPPPRETDNHKGTCNEHRHPDRDTRALCGLLARCGQVDFGAIRIGCLRAGE